MGRFLFDRESERRFASFCDAVYFHCGGLDMSFMPYFDSEK